MFRTTKLLLGTALALFLGVSHARADFLGIMTIEGTATGSLGGTAFTNAHVAFVATYHTANITLLSGIKSPAKEWTAAATVVIEVSGVGSAAFLWGGTVESYSSNYNHLGRPPSPPSDMGIFLSNGSKAYGVNGGFGSFDANYDLTTSFGPIQLGFLPPPAYQIGTAPTTAGDLTITSINYLDWTGQLHVAPAPSGLVLAGVGVFCLAGWGRLRRRRGKPAVSDA